MRRYIIRRILHALVVLWIVTVVVFVISRLSGSPVDAMVPPGVPDETREQLAHSLALDQPLPVQYVRFVSRALHGDFGESYRFQQSSMRLVLEAYPATIELALAALIPAIILGVTVGTLAAVRSGGYADAVVKVVLSIGQALPSFWVGILLIFIFGVTLNALPFVGRESPASIILPAATLALLPFVAIARMTRASVGEVTPSDFVRTARAKGLRSTTVLRRHLLRNGLLPVVTLTGALTAELLSGAVITEQIFSWPGVGWLTIQAIEARDYSVVQAVTLVVALTVIVLNLIVDLMYFWIDPRVRVDAGRSR